MITWFILCLSFQLLMQNLFSNMAADALASQVTDEDRESGFVYPPLNRIRQTSLHVGKAVANMAYKLGMCDC